MEDTLVYKSEHKGKKKLHGLERTSEQGASITGCYVFGLVFLHWSDVKHVNCEVWGSYVGFDHDLSLLGYDTVLIGNATEVWEELAASIFRVVLFKLTPLGLLRHWRYRKQAILNLWQLFTDQHDVIYQKIESSTCTLFFPVLSSFLFWRFNWNHRMSMQKTLWLCMESVDCMTYLVIRVIKMVINKLCERMWTVLGVGSCDCSEECPFFL